jgi:hypothetical protein
VSLNVHRTFEQACGAKMNRLFLAAATLATTLQAGAVLAQTTPTAPDTTASSSDTPAATPKKTTAHKHHSHKHKASSTDNTTSNALPDSTTQTPTADRPK